MAVLGGDEEKRGDHIEPCQPPTLFSALSLPHIDLTSLTGTYPSTTDMLVSRKRYERDEKAQKKATAFPCSLFSSLTLPRNGKSERARNNFFGKGPSLSLSLFLPLPLSLPLSFSLSLSLSLFHFCFFTGGFPESLLSPRASPVVARSLVTSTRPCRVLSPASRWRAARPARPRRRRGVSDFATAVFLLLAL